MYSGLDPKTSFLIVALATELKVFWQRKRTIESSTWIHDRKPVELKWSLRFHSCFWLTFWAAACSVIIYLFNLKYVFAAFWTNWGAPEMSHIKAQIYIKQAEMCRLVGGIPFPLPHHFPSPSVFFLKAPEPLPFFLVPSSRDSFSSWRVEYKINSSSSSQGCP